MIKGNKNIERTGEGSMYAQSMISDYEMYLRRALGLQAEPINESSHIYPADPELGRFDVEYRKEKKSVPTYEQAANSIR